MTGQHRSIAAIRAAVRAALAECAAGDLVLVAMSGGADSTALAAAAVVEASRLGLRAGAVIVDHGLQPDSADVAATAADRARGLGLDPIEVVAVEVVPSADGLEAAAREARHAALDEAASRMGARLVLLGHTRDDQAEQVLLGLARGSGARSLAGMPSARGRVRRPLLAITRADTEAACAAEDLPWWDDPMNADASFTRVRARRALADLERDLGPGVAAALARTADQLREDADLLDALADDAFSALADPLPADPAPAPAPLAPADPASADSRYYRPTSGGAITSNRREVGGLGVEVGALAELPRPIRTRVWRRLLIAAGAPAGQVSTRHTDACDRLLTHWHGQGPLHVPGDLRVARAAGRITIGLAHHS